MNEYPTIARGYPIIPAPFAEKGVLSPLNCLALLLKINPNPGIKPSSPLLQADSLLSEPLEKPLSISDTTINGIFSF